MHTNQKGSKSPVLCENLVPNQYPVPSPNQVPFQHPVPSPVTERVTLPTHIPATGTSHSKSPANNLASIDATNNLLGTLNMSHLAFPITELPENPHGLEPLPPLPMHLPAPNSTTPEIEPHFPPISSYTDGVSAAQMTSPFPRAHAELL